MATTTGGETIKLRTQLLIIYIGVVIIGATSEEGQQQTTTLLSINQSPSTRYSLVNSTADLECGINTLSGGDYYWTRDGVTLPGEHRNLVIKGVAKGDGGRYKCYFQLESGGVVFSPIIELVVVALEANNNTTVTSPTNTNLLLPCGVISTPLIGTVYSWRRNGVEIENNLNYLQIPPQFGGGLVIKNVGQDGDSFSCTATNLLLNKSTTSFTRLQIQEPNSPPNLIILPTFPPQIKLQETPAKLICAANNPLATVNWIITTNSDGVMATKTINNESIQLSWHNASGNYTCSASYGGDTVVKTTEASHPPLPFPPLPPLLTYPAAKTVRYECRSELREINWFKNGELLPPNKGRFKMKANELLISNTIQSDSGFYQCESGGRVGWGQLLIIGGVEDAPVQITCRGVTGRGIRVEWGMQGQDGGAGGIHAFTIHYMPTDGGEERQHVTTNNYYLLDTLQPNTNYTIYVRSYSDRSASGQSERVYCRTKLEEGGGPPAAGEGGGPPSPPLNPSHTLINGSLLIRWGAPSSKTAVVKGYTIEIRNRQNGMVTTTTNNETSTTISGLLPNTDYEYRVAAVSEEGVAGEYSNYNRFRILKRSDGMVGDGPKGDNKKSSQEGSGVSEQQMGAIFGSILAVLSVLIAMVIIVFRNRCFAYMAGGSRQQSNIRVGGKDSVDGVGAAATAIEMKVINTNIPEGGVLDTKGRHTSSAAAVPNGTIVQNSSNIIEDLEQREPLLIGVQQQPGSSPRRPQIVVHPIEEEQPP